MLEILNHISTLYGDQTTPANIITAIKNANLSPIKWLGQIKKVYKIELGKHFNPKSKKALDKALKLAFWFEIGALMLEHGNSPQEIIQELGAPQAVINELLKKYVENLPTSVKEFIYLLNKQRQMADQLLKFFKNQVANDLKDHQKAALIYFEDRVKLNPLDKYIMASGIFDDIV